jgi:enoyl-CoA hydratase
MSQEVLVTREGDCWTFTLNRPEKMNALNAELIEALLEGIEAAHAQGASVLVFRGAGRNLSAGFDFGGFEEQSEGDLLQRFVRIETLLQAIDSSPCLTVALAHGKNFGAGVDLFASCKWRVGTPDAFFRMPGLKFGLVLGTRRFGALVGNANARAILEEARGFGAQEAMEIGFLTHTAEEANWPELLTQAQARAAQLDAGTRAQLYQVLGQQAGYDADLAALVRSAAAPGLKERIRAYRAG